MSNIFINKIKKILLNIKVRYVVKASKSFKYSSIHGIETIDLVKLAQYLGIRLFITELVHDSILAVVTHIDKEIQIDVGKHLSALDREYVLALCIAKHLINADTNNYVLSGFENLYSITTANSLALVLLNYKRLKLK